LKGKIMTKTNIARILYDAYPHADLLPIDPEQDCRGLETLLAKVTEENIGDGLFKFIVTEAVEGGEGALDGAIRVMERAKEDVEAVLNALKAAGGHINEVIAHKAILTEQDSESLPSEINVNIVSEGGKLWLGPQGYGEKCTADGEGFSIGLEIWQGRLRLVVFDDINSEEPQIIDLEKAKECCRLFDKQSCNCQCACTDYGRAAEYIAQQGRTIFTGPMNGGLWNARCLDACIMSKKQCDKTAYEFLLKFGDQYIESLSDADKAKWHKIKNTAVALLSPAAPETGNIQ
jgi:hypothetical protein